MQNETQNTTQKKPEPMAMNGVNVPMLFATIDAVKNQPGLAQFQFRVSNRWVEGTNSRSTIDTFSGAGGEQKHKQAYEYDADHPEVLVGGDNAATPVEFILHGLAACLTAGIGNIASARGVKLTEVVSTVEGNIDLRGILGLSDEVRNGYQNIRVNFRVKGDAPPEKLEEIVAQSQARSAVFDIVSNGVPVEVNVDAS